MNLNRWNLGRGDAVGEDKIGDDDVGSNGDTYFRQSSVVTKGFDPFETESFG